MVSMKDGAIRLLRERKCWSQEDLAAKAGVSTRSVQRAEASKSSPSLMTITLLAEALEVAPSELLEASASSSTATENHGLPIYVMLRRVTNGKSLLDAVSGSLTMFHQTRGQIDSLDVEALGALADAINDYMDVRSEMSVTDDLRFAVSLTDDLINLQSRGWWIMAGAKHHSLRSQALSASTPWVTGVVLAARADDSTIVRMHGEQPAALVSLPPHFSFA